MRWQGSARAVIGCCVTLAATALAVPAIAAPALRFTAAATASLRRDAIPASRDRFTLRARLDDTTSEAPPAALSSSRYQVNAALTVAATACSFDTVFRDGFDGTGL